MIADDNDDGDDDEAVFIHGVAVSISGDWPTGLYLRRKAVGKTDMK